MKVLAAINVEQLKEARKELSEYIAGKNCNPIVVRLGWHDSGTYDKVSSRSCKASACEGKKHWQHKPKLQRPASAAYLCGDHPLFKLWVIHVVVSNFQLP